MCRMTLLAPQCHSLKEKRSVVRKVKDRVRARFHLDVSEVAAQDMWQRIVLGWATAGSDRRVVESHLADVVRFVDGMGLATVVDDEREVIVYGAERLGVGPGPSSLEPEPGRGDDGAEPGQDRDDGWIPDAWKNAAGTEEP
ncbi:DUF503 domain-containing protein [Haliangium sp.]|uniref:DUF503 domain-containing protein n=1 Tax=Haliangium sp. TaxID=2663208 RepID=UPI003D0A879B